ncbi:MAG: hypothetical protein JNK64_19050 [Myxococcales bacterium]|nr:hypothetical protein [Myxococcales bacterium]
MHVFSIEGRVTGPMGDDGVAGLIIDVADRDLIFYEALGQATTDEDGRFHKRYEAHGLEALFDARPEVSLVIRDARGAVVHRHEAADRCEAGRVVRVEVRLDEAQVAAHRDRLRPLALQPGARLVDARVTALLDAPETPEAAAVAAHVAALPPLLTSTQVIDDARRVLAGDPAAAVRLRHALTDAERFLAPAELPDAEVQARFTSAAAWKTLARTLGTGGDAPDALLDHDAGLALMVAAVRYLARDRGEAFRFAAVIIASTWRMDRLAPLVHAALAPRDARYLAGVRTTLVGLGRPPSGGLMPMSGMGFGGGLPGGGLPGGWRPGGGLPGGWRPGGGLPGELPGGGLPGELPGGGLPGDDGWEPGGWKPGGLPHGWEPGDPICPDPFPWWPDRFNPRWPGLRDRWVCVPRIVLSGLSWTITGIDRPDACPGDVVVVTGTNFGATRGSSTISFADPNGGRVDGVVVSWSDTRIEVRVPTDASTGELALRIPDGYVEMCNRHFQLYRPSGGTRVFAGGATRVVAISIAGGAGWVVPGGAVAIGVTTSNATSTRVRVTVDGGATLLDTTITAATGSWTVTAPAVATTATLRVRVDATGPCGAASEQATVWIQRPFALTVDGLEVTQAIQYYRAASHLTDPADRGADNSVPLVAGKAAVVRTYLRSGGDPGFGGGVLDGVDGTLLVERYVAGRWTTVSTLASLNGPVSADDAPGYVAERSAVGATLNFAVPAATMTGRMRFTARVSSPRDGRGTRATRTVEITIARRTTLQVAAVVFGYNGPNLPVPPAPPVNVVFPAPTAAQVTTELGWALNTYPVQAAPQVRIISAQTATAPLNGVVPPGGCDPAYTAINNAVQAARTADGNQATWSYYGFITPQIPIAHGNVGCSNGTVASGLLGGGQTVAHEIGHNYGLAHAPCGAVGGINAAYPVYNPYDASNNASFTNAAGNQQWSDASIGEFGFDVTNLAVQPPANTQDFMSYCGPTWISLFTWNTLYNQAGLNPVAVPTGFRAGGGMGMTIATHGPQPLVTIVGAVEVDGAVRVDHVWRSRGEIGRAPGAKTDLIAVVLDDDGRVVARAPVFAGEGCGGGGSGGCGCGCAEPCPDRAPGGFGFQAVVPTSVEGAALELRRGDATVWRRERPAVRIKPSAQARVERDGAVVVEWQGDGDEAWVRGSTDGGATWQALGVALRGGSHRLARAQLPTDHLLLEVVLHDGFRSQTVPIADAVALPPHPPELAIVHPADGARVVAGQPLRLWGAVVTPGSRGARDDEARWLVDGAAVAEGVEHWLRDLPAGAHTIELQLDGAAPVTIRVTAEKP